MFRTVLFFLLSLFLFPLHKLTNILLLFPSVAYPALIVYALAAIFAKTHGFAYARGCFWFVLAGSLLAKIFVY